MAVENAQLTGAKIAAVTALFLHRSAPRRNSTAWAKAHHAGSNLLAAATIATVMVISGAVIGAIFVLWPVPATAQTVDAVGAETASDLVKTVIDQGTAAIIVARELNSDTHAGVVFSDIFVEKFATDRIGRVLLGDYWATATPREQGEFITAFGVYLADRMYPGLLNTNRGSASEINHVL